MKAEHGAKRTKTKSCAALGTSRWSLARRVPQHQVASPARRSAAPHACFRIHEVREASSPSTEHRCRGSAGETGDRSIPRRRGPLSKLGGGASAPSPFAETLPRVDAEGRMGGAAHDSLPRPLRGRSRSDFRGPKRLVTEGRQHSMMPTGGSMPNTTDKLQHRRLARQTGREGFTLIEIMIVITIFAMMAGGVAVALLPRWRRRESRRPRRTLRRCAPPSCSTRPTTRELVPRSKIS